MVRENLIGTSVRVPREILERLEAVANRSKWSKGEIHRQALEFYLSILEKGHFLAPLMVGGPSGGMDDDPESAQAVILATMKRIEPSAESGALVGFRELRPASGLTGSAFDEAVLALALAGKLSLHRHDYASPLTDEVRAELLHQAGTYYVGCAIRRN